jgi:uncharacterized protein (TIGR03435 family)
LLLLFASVAFAQPSFDVASLKQSPPPEGDTHTANLGTARNGEVEVTNGTLADCIKFAYGLFSDDQLAGPSGSKSKSVRFDIRAKAAPSTAREQLLLMSRTLLAERFHLTFHPGRRSFAHSALVVAKGGPKLKEVTPHPSTARALHYGAHLTNHQMRMYTLALILSRQLRQLVLDRTGLEGVYDVELRWTPDGAEVETGPTVFTALQDQLGLRLEGRKDAVEVMVIEHADSAPLAS